MSYVSDATRDALINAREPRVPHVRFFLSSLPLCFLFGTRTFDDGARVHIDFIEVFRNHYYFRLQSSICFTVFLFLSTVYLRITSFRFAEIIPQSLCTRYGLYFGAKMAGPVRVLIWTLVGHLFS